MYVTAIREEDRRVNFLCVLYDPKRQQYFGKSLNQMLMLDSASRGGFLCRCTIVSYSGFTSRNREEYESDQVVLLCFTFVELQYKNVKAR